MSKHTPTPWKVVDNPDLPLGIVEVDEDGSGICNMEFDHERDKANAEIIVRAVNCHDELVYVVETMLFNYRNSHSEQRKTRLESLLARARGDSNV